MESTKSKQAAYKNSLKESGGLDNGLCLTVGHDGGGSAIVSGDDGDSLSAMSFMTRLDLVCSFLWWEMNQDRP
jgi:hypothetical protein